MSVKAGLLSACGLVALLAVQSQGALVASYAMDGNGNDSSGNGFDGTTFGLASYVAGHTGDALKLSGGSDYPAPDELDGGVSRAFDAGPGPHADSLLELNGSYTIAAWINPGATGVYGIVSIGENQADYNAGVSLLLINGVVRAIHNNGDNTYNFAPNIVSNGSTWTHLALVYSQADSLRTLYVDGVEVGTVSTPTPAVSNRAQGLRIGHLVNPDLGVFGVFDGLIDDVQIYNNALSASDVAALVPEPSMLSLAGVGIAAMARRRRHA